MVGETQPLNSNWLMSNINTNTIPGIQLSEAKAALSTNEAGKKVLENYKNIPSGQDPKIDEGTLTKLINDMSITDSVRVMTPKGIVTVMEGKIFSDAAPSEKEIEPQDPDFAPSREAVVVPSIEEAHETAPKTEIKEPLSKINDPAKAFRKDTPEAIRQKATDGNLTVEDAKMWATTTSKEGRSILGISGRMDASERAILVKQYYARKADGGKNAEKDTETDGKTEGTVKKAARTVTNAASAPVRWLMKGAGTVAGLFSKGAKEKINGWADGLKWKGPAAEEAPLKEEVSEAPDVADSPQTVESALPEVVEAENVVPETPPQVTVESLPAPIKPQTDHEAELAPLPEEMPATGSEPTAISIQPEDDALLSPLLTEKEPEISIQGDPEKIRETLEKNIENQEKTIQFLQDAIEAEEDTSKKPGMEKTLEPLIAQLERSKTLLEALNKEYPETPKEPTASE